MTKEIVGFVFILARKLFLAIDTAVSYHAMLIAKTLNALMNHVIVKVKMKNSSLSLLGKLNLPPIIEILSVQLKRS
jgi:hypothetical protein